MKTIMVVFSATHISDKLADYAIEMAWREKARLIVLDVRGINMSGKVTRMMEDVGFLGKKVLDQLQDEIKGMRGTVILRALRNIQQKAQKRGLETEFIVAKGPYIENILRVARDKKVGTIIVQKRIPESTQEVPFEVIYVRNGSPSKT